MTEETASYRATIIGIMIFSGAINTLGIQSLTQLTNFKISSLFNKVLIINTSFIRICKQHQCFLESF